MMRSRLRTIVLLIASSMAASAQAQQKSDSRGDDVVARGEYLARAGDCIACHTAPEGAVFAGSRAMPTPFGAIYSSNITPDREKPAHMQKSLLFIPGPVAAPAPVLAAMAKPLINHRGPEYARLLHSIADRMQSIFATKGDVLLMGSSGTGSLEAAVTNMFGPKMWRWGTMGAISETDMADALGAF